ncbi:MAG: hypothetical protein AB1758_04285 [Candidatus Eremiobacterota bacterium]
MARDLSGFTVAETILSAFVLSVVLMALFNIFPSSAMAARTGELQIRADSIAQGHLERLRARPFGSLAIGPVALSPASEKHSGVTFTSEAEVLRLDSLNPPADPDRLKAARVTVRWTFRGRGYRAVHETWIANDPR